MTTTINASTSSGLVAAPDNSGTIALQSNGTTQFTTDSTGAYGQLKASTAVNLSGTTVTLATGLPSWIKRITVIFNALNISGNTDTLVQLGTGAGPTYTTSGYSSTSGRFNYSSGTGGSTSTTGLSICTIGGASFNLDGSMVIHNVSGNIWVGSHQLGAPGIPNAFVGGGVITLGSTLTAVRLVSSDGSSTFSSGSVNIFYEG
jgi:hypothetical protein